MKRQTKAERIEFYSSIGLAIAYLEKQNERIAELEDGLNQTENRLKSAEEKIIHLTQITLQLMTNLPDKTDEIPF